MRENEDFYTVRKGDTIESIAEAFLGEARLAPLLRQINGDGEILPGMKILLHPEGLKPERKQKPKTYYIKKEK